MKTKFLAVTLFLCGTLLPSALTSCFAATPTVSTAYTVQRDIAYGDDPAQKLDVYYRSHLQGAPVILMVHGGGWRNGDKAADSIVTNKVNYWVPRGYVFISINYRLLPNTDPVTQANDVAKALGFAQKSAAKWGGDPTRFVLMGHSAGAHLVALLASDPTIAAQQGAFPWKGTVCLDSAAFNVVEIMRLPHLPLYDDAFGADPSYWKLASPYYRLSGIPAPILAVCSSKRPESELQSLQFVIKVRSVGARAERLPEDLTHREINEDLGLPSAYTRDVNRFIESLK